MPYKIYTYTDPYKINATDFWDGPFDHIRYYPQLCASRTLVNGLVSVMEDAIVSLICPIDDIVNDRIFRNWTKDISLRIRQYSAITRRYRAWNKIDKLTDNYLSALLHNSDDMLDSLRLFIELGIKGDSLSTDGMSYEHRMFACLLKKLENSELFTLPKMPEPYELHAILSAQAQKEKEEKERIHAGKAKEADDRYWRKEEQFLSRMIEHTKNWDGKHIVIHGIHQFTPLQLRFIEHLDRLGVEVIFLYNFIPEFREIYSSWSYIYQQFNVKDENIHSDSIIKYDDPNGQIQKPGRAIAENLALLCDESVPRTDARIRRNYELYKNIKVREFDNISEFAGYISNEFIDAEAAIGEDVPLSNTPFIKNTGTAAVLRNMKEVVYTANKDVDDLLQVYHPEYARNRHFLSYPVGQFFAALYAMWNPDTQSLDLDYNLIRECVNSGMLTKYPAETLLKTLMNVRPLFNHIKTMQDFRELVEGQYLNIYNDVQKPFTGPYHLKLMNIYNSCKVTDRDINSLCSAVSEIDQIASKLFSDSGNERFSFREHFRKLEEFVKGKKSDSMLSEEENTLISQLLEKLDLIQMSEDESGTFDDLRKGLYFFLKQKDEPDANWFVKNFEQIDGDVLCSKSQNKPGTSKTYHFACVSDADMNKSTDDLLPWPLSEKFIEKAYTPQELPFQVYYAALGERSNFLRYELFYGLFFNQCDSKISFVKRSGDNITDVYGLLTFIGLQKADGASDYSNTNTIRTTARAEATPVSTMPYNEGAMADMFLCPYRYFLDYVMNQLPVFSGTILFEKLYENLLVDKVWQLLQNKPLKMAERMLPREISNESTKLADYFPFFRDTEIRDLETRASNYVINQIFTKGNFDVPKYDQNLMSIRKLFGKASFYESGKNYSKKHPLEAFDKLADQDKGKKIYRLRKIYWQQRPELIKAALNYINEEPENMAHTGSWCELCPCRGICLETFADQES